jgi:hypothetical protein
MNFPKYGASRYLNFTGHVLTCLSVQVFRRDVSGKTERLATNSANCWVKYKLREWQPHNSHTRTNKTLQPAKVQSSHFVMDEESWHRVILAIPQDTWAYTYLNPCSRVLLEKLLVSQLVKKLPHFMDTEVHYRVHNSLLVAPILSQIDPLYVLPSHFFKIQFHTDPSSETRSFT